MPYSSTSELPRAIRDKYGSKCSRAFLHAFNSVYAEHGESRAFAAAHAAAKRCQGGKDMSDMDVVKGAEFKIFSGALTPVGEPVPAGESGERIVRTIASSSIEDLGGDVVTLPALQAMAESAKGMTIFRNHSYRVPDDVWGTTKHAEVKHAGTDGNGKPIYDLILDVKVRSDAKSLELYDAITKDGVRLGTSIGALIPPGAAKKNEAGGYTYETLNLKEASIVGIPQNPRSWVEYATKAWKRAEAEPPEDDEDTNEEFHVGVEEEAPAVNDVPGPSNPENPNMPDPEPVDTDKAAEPEVTKESDEPPADDEQDDEPAEGDDDEEPETVTASNPTFTASLDADEASEEAPAQELDASAPESAAEASPSEDDAQMDSMLTQSVDVLTDVVKSLTRERGQLVAKVAELTEQRDAAIQTARDAVANANLAVSIAKQMGETPLARKAVFKEQEAQLSDAVKAVYAPGVIKMLENTDGS